MYTNTPKISAKTDKINITYFRDSESWNQQLENEV